MSLADSPGFVFQPDHLNFAPADDCNLFDEVFDHKLYEVDDHKLREDDAEYFETVPYSNPYPRLPSLSGSTSQETSTDQSPQQPWRKGLWCLNQDTLKVDKTRKPAQDTITAAELLNNQSFLIRSPPSPSVSPTMNPTKRFVTSPNAAKYQYKAMDPPPSRENTLSPSPMYSQLPLQAKMEQVETWQQDFKNFNIQTSQRRSQEKPLHELYHNHGTQISDINNAIVAKNAESQLPLLSNNASQEFLYNEDGGVAVDPSLIHKNRNSLAIQTRLDHCFQPAVLSQQACHQTLHPTWTTESLHSSNDSHPSSYDTMPASMSSAFSSNGLQPVQSGQGQVWWSPDMTTTTPGWVNTYHEPFSTIAAPTPKRAATQSYVENIDRRSEGLGINYPDSNTASLHDHNTFYPSIESANFYSPSRSQGLPAGIPPVPPLPFPTSNHILNKTSPFTTPYTSRRSPSRPPSPCISPLSMTPRSTRRQNRSPSHHSNHRRRKSMHKPGPIKSINNNQLPIEDPYPSTPIAYSSSHYQHHNTTTRARSRSHSKPPPPTRTPRTPKTPTTAGIGGSGGGSFNLDFVNFTARDSAKLLGDVAPSGSSKTRARREAEAREKRKRLGEAALRAVTSAGGDVEALKRAILT
ncbi:uncharacterized protein HMPREF1541_08238 [Cyphellophora europaea CBS 101466]|uniref:Developmental regulatory protein wetA n=1 Tax=Cyphellophora europaea (strain CBS 101466) TaxID=1220924 RepID=W2RL88_CYPE1|nr:uncharacterized protein HMPREF1541_08238 [Cyphellophora europaea CBS 101466]ETN37247.1 hypothetical protein HMPREF1541_08238 [Cyphellophora europaea CBS 101466]